MSGSATVIKSLRVSPDTWAEVQRVAKVNGVSPNRMAVAALEVGLGGSRAVARVAELTEAAKVHVQTKIGPARPKPGSLLKPDKPPKAAK